MSVPIKAIIYDLDNCLAPAKEVGMKVAESAFQAIRAANQGTLSPALLEEAIAECWNHPLDWIAKTYSFSAEMVRVAQEEFAAMHVTGPMQGYGDLHILGELPTAQFLVTTGFRVLQESKITALGIGHHFITTYIDVVDSPDRIGKKGFFSKILAEYNFHADEVLVIGDNPNSEIAAGNALGIKTVQILRPDVNKGATATFYVENLLELKELYFQLAR